jgi:hypothetical protein
MTSFAITTAQNMTALVGKGGNDTYSINGGTLTIDSDTRYGPNTTPNTGPMGNVIASATQGGNMVIRGDNVRLIPYNGGAGNVPAAGTSISRQGVTAELLCVMASRVGGAVTPSGSPLPISAWLKVRNVSSVGAFPVGPLTGIGASSTATDELGWIEVVGVETFGMSISRLNTLTVTGEWFSLGVTSGVRGQTIQLPAFEVITEYPGLEIETAVGSGVYAFWANASSKFRGDTIGADSRARMVGINATGLATIGTGLDAQPAGDLPSAGRRIRVPNIILSNCANANRAVNAVPSATMGNRYELNSSGSGVIFLTRVTGPWFWNITQPQSVAINDLHTNDHISVTESSIAPIINGLHVGLSNMPSPVTSIPISIGQHYAGDTSVSNISGLRAEGNTGSAYAIQFVNCYGRWDITRIRGHYASDCTSVSGPLFFNTCDDVTVNAAEVVGKRMVVNACARFALNGLTYADNVRGNTLTTVACHAVEVMGNSKVVSINGVALWPGVANVHPYTGLVYLSTVFDFAFTGTGSPQAPLDAGTVNRMGYLFADGGNNARCRFRRNWLTGLRLGLSNSNNTSVNIQMQNCYNVDASLTLGPNWQNSQSNGNRHNGGAVPTSFVHVTGSHFWDSFTGDTSARAAIIFVEKSSTLDSLAAYTIDSGSPKFTAQGALVMTMGDRITWSWNYNILGWTGLSSMAVTGTNATTNHLYEYDLDKGVGYSGTFKTMSNANLAAETGISASGFRAKIRITGTVANANNQITSLRFDGTTTLAAQNAALYPLDFATLNLTGLLSGSSVALFANPVTPGAVPVVSTQNTNTAASFTYVYDPAVTSYTLRVRKPGFNPIDLIFSSALLMNIPLAQQENKDGFGVQIYGRGSGTTSSFVSVSESVQRIDIANTRCEAEDVYNAVALWQATATGMRYPEALRFDGTDLLVLGSWRFRRALSSHTSAGIDALPVIDGNPTGSSDDESNGSVDFRARSVRTYQLNAAPAITAADLAAAVWAFAQGNGASAEANLRAARTAAENAFAVSA